MWLRTMTQRVLLCRLLTVDCHTRPESTWIGDAYGVLLMCWPWRNERSTRVASDDLLVGLAKDETLQRDLVIV